MKKNYFIINPDGDQPVIPGDLIVIDFEEIHDEVRADITLLSERHDTEKFLQLATRRLTGFFQNYCPPSAGEYILCDCDPEIIAYITSENGIAKVYTKEMYDMQDEAYKLNIMRVLSHLDDAFNFL